MDIWRVIFIEPIINVLALILHVIPDIGWAIIILTIIIRLILAPLSQKSLKSQAALKELQPEMERIKTQYKDDKEGLNRALMEFYKQNKINPLSSCLPVLIQIPIMIALYQVFISGLAGKDIATYLYSWVPNPGIIDPHFMGLIDLSKPDKFFILPILAGALQFVQSWMMMPKGKSQDQGAMMSKQMAFMMPLLTVFIAWSLPAGLPLYWIVTTVFAIVQQALIKKPKLPQISVFTRKEKALEFVEAEVVEEPKKLNE